MRPQASPARRHELFERISDNSGVGFSAHILRHTWATNCRLAGMDLLTLKEQGGWSRWEMVVLPNPTAQVETPRRGKDVAFAS